MREGGVTPSRKAIRPPHQNELWRRCLPRSCALEEAKSSVGLDWAGDIVSISAGTARDWPMSGKTCRAMGTGVDDDDDDKEEEEEEERRTKNAGPQGNSGADAHLPYAAGSRGMADF